MILPMFFFRFYIFTSMLVLVLIATVVFLGDLVYMVGETAFLSLSTSTVALLSLFRLSELIVVDMLPVVVVVGSAVATVVLIRNRVMLVVQSMGYSLWSLLLGPCLGMAALGLIVALLLSPLSTLLYNWHVDILQRYQSDEQYQDTFEGGRVTWLQKKNGMVDLVIRAEALNRTTGRIKSHVQLLYFDEEKRLERIVSAKEGLVSGSTWQMFDVESRNMITGEVRESSFVFTTGMPTLEDLNQPSLGEYRVSLFGLPSYIAHATEVGFEVPLAERRYHLLLSLPFLLVSAALCGIFFASRVHHRGGGVLDALVFSLIFSVGLFFVMRLLSFIALSGMLSGWLSVWILPVIIGSGALGLLVRGHEG